MNYELKYIGLWFFIRCKLAGCHGGSLHWDHSQDLAFCLLALFVPRLQWIMQKTPQTNPKINNTPTKTCLAPNPKQIFMCMLKHVLLLLYFVSVDVWDLLARDWEKRVSVTRMNSDRNYILSSPVHVLIWKVPAYAVKSRSYFFTSWISTTKLDQY